MDEEVDPNISRQPDDHRHKNHQGDENCDKGLYQGGF